MNRNIEDFIIENLEYKDGQLFWKKRGRARRVGKPAGTFNGRNVVVSAKIGGKMVRLLVHRVIFWIHFGYWPAEIDHIDRNPLNNLPSNLRDATSTENKYNMGPRKDNTTGIKNVYWFKPHKKYKVQLKINKRAKTFGYFDDIELAELVAQEARKKYHGEYAS